MSPMWGSHGDSCRGQVMESVIAARGDMRVATDGIDGVPKQPTLPNIPSKKKPVHHRKTKVRPKAPKLIKEKNETTERHF